VIESGQQHVLHGLSQGLHLVVTGNPVIVDTTVRTLQLAVVATAIAAALGVPAGAALGLGRSPASRGLRALANGLTRVPPVASGLLVLLLVTEASPWGGGPLAGLNWYSTTASAYLAQTLLAIPIMTALTAAAVQGVAPVLVEQARAYGASRPRLARLAVREARGRVIAALLVTLGVAITSIGAIAVSNAPVKASVQTQGGHLPEPATLALGAFQSISQTESATDTAPEQVAASLGTPTDALAVAYATVLLGLFVVIAAALTWVQQTRSRWIPGLLS
jgi:tungstate transport system permease protein